jgi:hypothetical protein
MMLDSNRNADSSASMNMINEHLSGFLGTFKSGFQFVVFCLAAFLSCSLAASVARADDHFYGTVEAFGGGKVIVKTTKHSTGHWTLDAATEKTGSVKVGDWVFVEVETSGHLKILRFEERPTAHAGVIQKIHEKVLSVHSGSDMVNWNLTETTMLNGVALADLKVGDEIGVKLYKNHNLAELRVIKSGVK